MSFLTLAYVEQFRQKHKHGFACKNVFVVLSK